MIKKKYFYNWEINDYSNVDKDKVENMIKYLFISYIQEEVGFE